MTADKLRQIYEIIFSEYDRLKDTLVWSPHPTQTDARITTLAVNIDGKNYSTCGCQKLIDGEWKDVLPRK